MPATKIFLIDGHALCYRAFYAIAELANSKGQPTNAVYGFISTLRKILREHAPSHMAVCFDVGKKTRRQEKFAEYKIQRPSMPEGLISQIPIIKKVIEAYRIPVFEMEGYEADDLIGTITQKLKNKGTEIVIASDDKDMYQLVTDRVSMYSFRQDKILGTKESEERFGIKPSLIADYIGLCGDNADNIPGVNGVGEVTARNLVNEFGTLDNLYKHLQEVKQAKLREKLVTQKDAAFFSKGLAVLEADAPLDVSLEDLKIHDPDSQELFRLFNELEFRKFAQEFSGKTSADVPAQTRQLETADDFKNFEAMVKQHGSLAVLLEYSKETGECTRIWLAAGSDAVSLDATKASHVKALLNDERVAKIAYNVKELKNFFNQERINGDVFDALLAGYLLLSGQAAFDIPALSWQYLKEAIAEGDHALSTAALLKLAPFMKKDLEAKDLWKLYQDLELPLTWVLAAMEHEGVKIDTQVLSKLSQECEGRILDMTSRLYAMAGVEFNLNSPKQLSEVLFVRLKLPVIKKTKTGFSTDEEVLSRLAAKHEIAQLILAYRQISKLKSTYIDALPKLVNPKTNRLHATFNQTGTETGRLSSNNPNLQNIPIRTEMGREIRRAFIALNKSDVLLSADYSQIELRVLAHLAHDENLIKAFKDDQDIHAYTAGLIFDVPESKVDASMRNAAKRVNFGIIYGISAFGLAKDLGVSSLEAQDFIDRYFLRYPRVKAFMDGEIKKAQELGYVTTILNRRRYIPEINSKNIGLRQFAERQAINTPVQGSAADLMKLAMVYIQDELQKKKLKSKMLITVHDELVFNVPSDEKNVMAALVREKMENVLKLAVPITVSIKVGRNWLEMDKV